MTTDAEIFAYHELPRAGKVATAMTKPCHTQQDLSLTYTPGVARPALAIASNPDDVFRYTNRGNLVAVVTNGTAVLGLGNIGPLAAKPVMEGKAALFRRLANIDAFDLELDSPGIDETVRVVRALSPTFGGILLEDIRAPDCFSIEERLTNAVQIPVLHDDQHGTAIVVAAAFLNALAVAGKAVDDVSVVFSGAGAAAIACAEICQVLGVRREQMLMVDSVGVLHRDRDDITGIKARYVAKTSARTLADAVAGADVFVGLSIANILTPRMLRAMASRPVVLAMANPDPEIPYHEAIAARPDALIATGRSDFPNQVNNALAFPSVFRGALDVRARAINDAMKLAAARALATLAREEVPDDVRALCGLDRPAFGPDCLLPHVLDPRVLPRTATAVACAAIESGVANRPIADLAAYTASLERLSRTLIEEQSRPRAGIGLVT